MNQTVTVDDQAAQLPHLTTRVLWIAIVFLLSVALARIAVWLQMAHFAALGVFPIAIGAVVGGLVIWTARYFSIRDRMLVVCGAVFAALMVAAAEHGLFYLDYRSHILASIQDNPKAQMLLALDADQFQPATFYRFMAAEAPAKWPLWIEDAAAMIAIAALIAWLLAPGRPLTTDH
jgi:hypothetical protein